MVTHDTTELGLAFAIAAFGMPTCATSLAGVGRIDKRYWHTCSLRFVADKRSQLAEGPIAMSRSLLPCNPCPRSDALEILKDKRTLRAFGFSNQPLADVVIGIFVKAPLATSELTQAAFGRLRSDLLERLTAHQIPLAAALDLLARKRFTVAVGRQIDNAQIDAQDTRDIDRLGRLDFASNEQIPFATDQRQIGFPALGRKQFTLASATDEREDLPPIKRPDRNFRTFQVIRENAIVIGNRTQRRKRPLQLPIPFVRIGDFGDTAHRKLRGQMERLAHRLIGQVVDRELAKGFRLPCHLTDEVARGVGCLKRVLKRVSLCWRREQLQLNCESHDMTVYPNPNVCASASWLECAIPACGATRLIRAPKGGGFRLVRFL
jgi:hypothetical protein